MRMVCHVISAFFADFKHILALLWVLRSLLCFQGAESANTSLSGGFLG